MNKKKKLIIIKKQIFEHLNVVSSIAKIDNKILLFVNILLETIKKKNKIIIFGNGGSAADSMHFAAELSGKYKKKNRRSLPVICLSENISSITAIANDYDYDLIFKKQLEGIVNKGDLVIGVTTSGKSKNIIEALKYCKEKKIKSAAFLGSNKKSLSNYCDFIISIDSTETARIQESHMLIFHIVCEILENYF
jgi:D-sedoheptulose 7-phosphate isomerase